MRSHPSFLVFWCSQLEVSCQAADLGPETRMKALVKWNFLAFAAVQHFGVSMSEIRGGPDLEVCFSGIQRVTGRSLFLQ